MKSKDMQVGMEVAIGAPRSIYTKPQRGFIIDPQPWWHKKAYMIGSGLQPPIKNQHGNCVAVAMYDRNYEAWVPEVVLPSHVLMTWADYLKKQEAEGKAKAEQRREKDAKTAEIKTRQEHLAKLLEKRGLSEYEVSFAPASSRSFREVSMSIDTLEKILTQ